MASGKTTYLGGKALQNWYNGTAFTFPATTYIGLFTDAAGTSHAAGTATEVSTTATAYARVAVASTAAQWGTPVIAGAGPPQAANVNAVNFPTPTANWGVVTQFGVWDAASAGNLLAWGDLSSAQTINIGNAVSFPVGTLVIQET